MRTQRMTKLGNRDDGKERKFVIQSFEWRRFFSEKLQGIQKFFGLKVGQIFDGVGELSDNFVIKYFWGFQTLYVFLNKYLFWPFIDNKIYKLYRASFIKFYDSSSHRKKYSNQNKKIQEKIFLFLNNLFDK